MLDGFERFRCEGCGRRISHQLGVVWRYCTRCVPAERLDRDGQLWISTHKVRKRYARKPPQNAKQIIKEKRMHVHIM